MKAPFATFPPELGAERSNVPSRTEFEGLGQVSKLQLHCHENIYISYHPFWGKTLP